MWIIAFGFLGIAVILSIIMLISLYNENEEITELDCEELELYIEENENKNSISYALGKYYEECRQLTN